MAVYDERAKRGHLLSPLCATVYRLADGVLTLTDLATAATRTDPSTDTMTVQHAVAELNSAGLLDVRLAAARDVP